MKLASKLSAKGIIDKSNNTLYKEQGCPLHVKKNNSIDSIGCKCTRLTDMSSTWLQHESGERTFVSGDTQRPLCLARLPTLRARLLANNNDPLRAELTAPEHTAAQETPMWTGNTTVFVALPAEMYLFNLLRKHKMILSLRSGALFFHSTEISMLNYSDRGKTLFCVYHTTVCLSPDSRWHQHTLFCRQQFRNSS